MRTLTLLILSAMIAVCVASVPSVNLTNGVAHGIAETPECNAFLGLKFGTASRFESPVLWSEPGPFNATQYGPWCPQLDDNQVSGSEDCLYLNLCTSDHPASNHALAVWRCLCQWRRR